LDLQYENGAFSSGTALDRLARKIVLSAAEGENRKIGMLLPLVERLGSVASESENEAESVSLPQGKKQGKNKNSAEPNGESKPERAQAAPAEPENAKGVQ